MTMYTSSALDRRSWFQQEPLSFSWKPFPFIFMPFDLSNAKNNHLNNASLWKLYNTLRVGVIRAVYDHTITRALNCSEESQFVGVILQWSLAELVDSM